MIYREVPAEIKLSAHEIESEIWGMDAVQQAFLIGRLAERYRKEPGNVSLQLSYMTDEVDNLFNDQELRDAIRFFEELLVYLKEIQKVRSTPDEMSKL